MDDLDRTFTGGPSWRPARRSGCRPRRVRSSRNWWKNWLRKPPRRLALCEVDSELPDARVFAWGLAEDDGEAVVVGIEDHSFGRFRSAERAHQLFSLSMDCRLVWIDPEREDN